MGTVQEIESAIEHLGRADLARLAEWAVARHHGDWARQMNSDAAAGRLDFLFNEADSERRAGALRSWPAEDK